MNKQETNEAFEFLPKWLELYGYVTDDPVYSNETITSASLDWIRKSHITSPIASKIEEGLDTRRIMIGYTKPGIYNFLIKRMKFKLREKHFLSSDVFISSSEDVLGIYGKSTNTLAILLDPSKVSIFGKALTNVPSILAHELCHMAACTNTSKYLNIMKSSLIDFYKMWIKNVFEYHKIEYDTKKLNDSNIRKLIDDLTITYEGGDFYSTEKGLLIWIRIFEIFLKDDEEIKKCVKSVSIPFYYFMIDYKDVDSKQNIIDCVRILSKTYKDVGINGVLGITTPSQEFLFTSEVVCVMNQFKLSPEAIKLIKNINMGK